MNLNIIFSFDTYLNIIYKLSFSKSKI